MYLELQLSKERQEGLRRLAKIRVVCNPTEKAAQKEIGVETLQCQTPLPIGVFQNEDPSIRATGPATTGEGKPWKAYFLPKSPKVVMARPLQGKTAVKIPAEGETILGWINPREIHLLKRWWEKAQNEFLNNTPKPASTITNSDVTPEFEQVGKTQNTAVASSQTPVNTISKRRGIRLPLQ